MDNRIDTSQGDNMPSSSSPIISTLIPMRWPSWFRISSAVIFIIVIWIVCLKALHDAQTHRKKQATSQAFKAFTTDNKCTPAKARILYGFISTWRHKFHLISHRKGDLLGGSFGDRFKAYGGSTYAVYDSYGLPKTIHTIDPLNVHTVLSSRSQDYGIPAARLSGIGPIGSKGVVMTEGNLWQQNRKMINMGFRGARFTHGIEENAQIFFGALEASANTEGWTTPFHIFDSFAFMSLDRSIRHMFGVKADLQAESGEPMKQRLRWKEAFDTVARYVGLRSVLGRQAWLCDGVAFRRACALLRRLCESTIRAAVQDTKDGRRVPASFVGNLVQESSDVRRIADITLDIFIAGHNMTAGVLSWLFLEMEKRPDVYEDVRREVLDAFGTESHPKTEMTWDRLQQCPKLHNAIYEAMRLYPTLPNIGRAAIKDTVLPTGGGDDGAQPMAVAKGTVIMCCLYLMHRGPEWGAETDKYKPERWLGRKPGYGYAPFGGGPRVCPGQLFGLVELFYVTARIMQRFQAIRKPDDGVEVKGSGAGVLLPPEGATLQFRVA